MTTSEDTEEWRPIQNSYLQVSNLGNVRSSTHKGLWSLRARGAALATGHRHWRPIRPFPNTSGYLQVGWMFQGKRYAPLVHRLVLETFASPRPPGMEARHLNGNHLDNRLENLAWGTQKENRDDVKAHAKLPRRMPPAVRAAVLAAYQAGGTSCRLLAAEHGVSQGAIHRLVSGKSYR